MKNVLINTINAKSGGQMTYLVNLLSEAASLGDYRFTFLINMVAENLLKSAAVRTPENVSIHAVASNYSYGTTSYLWQVVNLPRIIREIKPDYVYAPTHIAYKVPGVKTILAMRNMAIPNFLKIDVPLGMRLNLLLKYWPSLHSLRKADKVVAVSDYVKHFIKKKIGKDDKDIFVAYHIINSLHKNNDSRLERCGNLGKNDYIIFVPGSYYRYKKFHALLNYLEAVKLPPNAKVIFAGDEADTKYLSQLKLYSTNSYEPIFKVSLNTEQMQFFYRVARLVILSSQVEACPNIALEALANNSRVLASDIPPFKEILGDFAVYFNVNDKNDFVKKFEIAASCEPEPALRAEQMKKVSHGSSLLDILRFCQSD
jgi:glycosyltransferase involved in cell wall biosynthesis